ncbi:MAG: B12-binding domain-containing radical SAM protein [Promethearchaeota archaeon]
MSGLGLKWKKVLLIMPNYRMREANRFIQRIYPPIGLMYIASYLSDLNVEIKIIDAKNENLNTKELKDKIKEFNPDIVGISVLVCSSIKTCNDIAKMVKKLNKESIVVFGGRQPSMMPEKALELEEVDIIVRGEGELTFRELIIKGSPENVKGISYKSNGNIIHNPERELMKNLNDLRCPARNLIGKNKYTLLGMKIDTIQTSRGCPHRCRFCTTPIANNGSWRPRPVDSIITELKMISQNRKITDIIILDDNFTANIKRVENLCSRIIEGKNKGELNDFKFYAQIRVDSILKAPQMIKKMSEAGFWSVLIGIESVNDETLKNMKKRMTFNEVLKAIQILHFYNISVFGSVIIGFDLTATEEDIIKEINYMKKIDVDILVLNLLTPYPGTPIYNELEEKDLIITKDWNNYTPFKPVYRTSKLSSKKLQELLQYAFKHHAYHKRCTGFVSRIIKTRGFTFVFNPKRIISTIFALLKANLSLNKFFN